MPPDRMCIEACRSNTNTPSGQATPSERPDRRQAPTLGQKMAAAPPFRIFSGTALRTEFAGLPHHYTSSSLGAISGVYVT